MKNSGIGGQAVIEGIMMRNKDEYAVAVRLSSGEIKVKKEKFNSVIRNKYLKTIPFIRGFFNFIDSLTLGISTLSYSADMFAAEENAAEINKNREEVNKNISKSEGKSENETDTIPKAVMIATIAFSFLFAIFLFVIVPLGLSSFIGKNIESNWVKSFIEGVIRLAVFILYIGVISCFKDIKRIYMYHGGEHKCINCIENGLPLTVENVRKSSKEHKRCGTSFLLFVILFSIIIGMFISVKVIWLKVLIRLLLIPIIAGISYEFIKVAGNTNNSIVNFLSKPGLWMQGMTVKEPDDSMIEVAIKAVEEVFDWEEFLERYNNE